MFILLIVHSFYAPDRSEGGNKRCYCPSVCLSVYPSVAYIANNSTTQRPSVSKFGMTVQHLRCDSHTSFKIKRSKIKVTRAINTDIHRAPYIPNGKAYELQTWCADGGRRPASATGAKVKGQSRKVTRSVWAVIAQWRTCVIRGRRGHTVSAKPGGHTSCYVCRAQLCDLATDNGSIRPSVRLSVTRWNASKLMIVGLCSIHIR